jgi:O-antigen/teichoic acid export membrane protein
VRERLDGRAAQGEDRHGELPHEELRRRAASGVFIVATRGVAILLLGFAGSVVVARLLTPHDFGVIAIGMSFVYFISTIADGGLGAALIRRPEPPAREELQALLALQLAVTVALAVAAAVIAWSFFGSEGLVIALMISSMPIVMLQFPGRILLERTLSYRPLAVVEVSQVLVYQAWAIGFVVAGFGVWGLASATVAMRVAGAVVMAVVCPAGILRPRFGWHRIRSLVGFGSRFQAANATALVQEQGLNVSIAAFGSVSTLGLWSLARRVMEVPMVLFDSLWRVSYPTMAHLLAAKRDVARLLERAVGMAAVASGIILTGLAGSSPGLIPGLFGEQWRPAATVLPIACLALAIGGPLSVATVGYLYAVGDASAVLRAHVLRALTLFIVALPLLPVLGARAAAIGWLASSVADAAVLTSAARRSTDAALVSAMRTPTLTFIVSAAIGWAIADLEGADLASGLVGGACSVLVFVLILFIVRRTLLEDIFHLAVSSVSRASSRQIASDVV